MRLIELHIPQSFPVSCLKVSTRGLPSILQIQGCKLAGERK